MVDLSQFATLKGSQADGANKSKPRITNLMQLTTSIEHGGAVATIQGFTADGLFIGQSSEFFRVIIELAEEADKAA